MIRNATHTRYCRCRECLVAKIGLATNRTAVNLVVAAVFVALGGGSEGWHDAKWTAIGALLFVSAMVCVVKAWFYWNRAQRLSEELLTVMDWADGRGNLPVAE
jgi:hypothetical protein